MKKERNAATEYSAMKRIYQETYREDATRRMRDEAASEKENCS